MVTAVVVFGGIGIWKGSIDLADLIVFLLYINNFTDPILRFGEIVQQYQQGFTGFERFMEIIETEPEIQDSANAIGIQNVRGHVEFRNVSFRYRDDHSMCLKISPEGDAGDYVAIVGSSGVGKTTYVPHPRFYEVRER
jgi:ATP-binding cassette subfamily B protein